MAFISDTTSGITISPTNALPTFKSQYDCRSRSFAKYIAHNVTGARLLKDPYEYPLDSSTQNIMYTVEPYCNVWEGDAERLANDVKNLAITGNIDPYTRTPEQLWQQNIEAYNRFKLPFTTNALTHTMSHVFFTRPNCNIFEGSNLTPSAQVNSTLSSIYMRNPYLLSGLCHTTPPSLSIHGNFNYLLSNAATSFQLTDEYIDTGSTSKTLDGHQFAYGKLNTASKASGSFTVNFDDDRNLSVFQQLKAWVDYISGVYIGEIDPTYSSVINRELDYAANVYYILTAEDGYTILFWSKYYGVFPKTIPSSQYSWTKGNTLSLPSLSVEFQYSFKEDYILDTITEFNTDSYYDQKDQGFKTVQYAPMFNSSLNKANSTWVGAPFIDTVKGPRHNANNQGFNNLLFHLMFRPSYSNSTI